MKKELLLSSAIVAGIAVCFSSCTKEEIIPDSDYAGLNLPSTPYTYNSLFASDEMIELGRVLFYDKQISVNSSISCNTCHKQEMGFSDDVEFDLGYGNRISNEEIPVVSTPQSGDNGDGAQMENQEQTAMKNMMKRYLFNHAETGMQSEAQVIENIRSVNYYAELFNNVYGTEQVDMDKVADALTAFTESITAVKVKGNDIKTDARFSSPFK